MRCDRESHFLCSEMTVVYSMFACARWRVYVCIGNKGAFIIIY